MKRGYLVVGRDYFRKVANDEQSSRTIGEHVVTP